MPIFSELCEYFADFAWNLLLPFFKIFYDDSYLINRKSNCLNPFFIVPFIRSIFTVDCLIEFIIFLILQKRWIFLLAEASYGVAEATSEVSEATSEVGEAPSEVGAAPSEVGGATSELSRATSEVVEATSGLGYSTSVLGAPASEVGGATSEQGEATSELGVFFLFYWVNL